MTDEQYFWDYYQNWEEQHEWNEWCSEWNVWNNSTEQGELLNRFHYTSLFLTLHPV